MKKPAQSRTPTKAVRKKSKRVVNRSTLRTALVTGLKQESGRKDIKFQASSKTASKAMRSVPLEQRAGYPLKRPKGSVDPKDWITAEGVKVFVDFGRSPWMPDDWGQGVKITQPTCRSYGGGGGTLTSYVAPDGKVFYHKSKAQEYAGRTFTLADGFNGQVRLAQLQAQQAVQLARMQIKAMEDGEEPNELIGTDSDVSFFKVLSAGERKHLPKADEFHFCVISARRAKKLEGVRDLLMVQTQFSEAGVTPTWYVDEDSVKDYRALGLRAVVGGKLTAARNRALQDARCQGKACVQVSDDISAWEYRDGPNAKERTDDAQNAAHMAARRYIVSPVAAARFILAKMRSADHPRPQLGGVYMLGSCARTFGGDAFSRHHFILGDFFVVDDSKVRFDEEMRLKEDYDFTCSHIKAHGSVMRCNRMTLNVKHYANDGGACTNRDAKGREEQRNIEILQHKWPGAFRANPKRRNEVIMRWKPAAAAEEDDADDVAGDDEGGGGARRVKVAAATKKTRRKTGCAAKLPERGVLCRTSKATISSYIAARCRKATGLTVGRVLAGGLHVRDKSGRVRAYLPRDLVYDLKCGYLSLKAKVSKA